MLCFTNAATSATATAVAATVVMSSASLAQPDLVPAAPSVAASAYFLMDANSGKVLIEHNADERLPPASLTKLMTSYVLSYELERGQVSNDDLVVRERLLECGSKAGTGCVGEQVHQILCTRCSG